MNLDRTKSVAVLAFHKIGDPPGGSWFPTWFYIPEEIFTKQLTFLREERWTVIDLESFLIGLDQPETLPERSVLITFDDGYRSITGVALRCLRRFNFPAVLFVPSDYIGGINAFSSGVEPEEPICTWDDLKLLNQVGISIQSHSASHSRFSRLESTAQREEIVRSKAVLEAGLSNSVTTLAYPYGDSGSDRSAGAKILREAGYRAAFLYGSGMIDPLDFDCFRLARIAMGPDTDLRLHGFARS
jgi:peptidoglycan/xylan/chitin deacetylase (PgdA/CDA1 family)